MTMGSTVAALRTVRPEETGQIGPAEGRMAGGREGRYLLRRSLWNGRLDEA